MRRDRSISVKSKNFIWQFELLTLEKRQTLFVATKINQKIILM